MGAALPTYVGAGAASGSASALTPALPGSLLVGDILLLPLETADQAITIATANGGTWTEVTGSPASALATTRLTVFWSRYNGTQTAPVTSDSGDHQAGIMLAFRGCPGAGNPWDVTSASTDLVSQTSGSATGATTTVVNTLVVIMVGSSDPDLANTGTEYSAWANADLGSVTERTDNNTLAGNGGGLGTATGTRVAAGAYGATTFTQAHAATKAMMTVALMGASSLVPPRPRVRPLLVR